MQKNAEGLRKYEPGLQEWCLTFRSDPRVGRCAGGSGRAEACAVQMGNANNTASPSMARAISVWVTRYPPHPKNGKIYEIFRYPLPPTWQQVSKSLSIRELAYYGVFLHFRASDRILTVDHRSMGGIVSRQKKKAPMCVPKS